MGEPSHPSITHRIPAGGALLATGLDGMLRRHDEIVRDLADHAQILLTAFLEVARGRPG